MKLFKSQNDLREELKLIVKQSLDFKKQGNDYFSKKNYNNAIDCYNKALLALENMSATYDKILEQTNISNIKIECFNNIAICYLIKPNFELVLEFTDKSLNIQKKNYKSLYIRSRALKKLGKWEEASDVIKKVRLIIL